MKKACFPGSFDPFTKGHEDVVRRGLDMFDKIVIAVGFNTSKQPLFELESRLAHIRSLFDGIPQVEVKSYTGLTTAFCEQEACTQLLRGLRDVKDFNYEQPIALMNRKMTGIETVFVLPAPELLAINSTIVREIFKSGGKIDAFVTNAGILVNKA